MYKQLKKVLKTFVYKLNKLISKFLIESTSLLNINLKTKYKSKIMLSSMILFIQLIILRNYIQVDNILWHWWIKEKSIDLCMEIMDLNWNLMLNLIIIHKIVWDFVDNQLLKLTEFHLWKASRTSLNALLFFLRRLLIKVIHS